MQRLDDEMGPFFRDPISLRAGHSDQRAKEALQTCGGAKRQFSRKIGISKTQYLQHFSALEFSSATIYTSKKKSAICKMPDSLTATGLFSIFLEK